MSSSSGTTRTTGGGAVIAVVQSGVGIVEFFHPKANSLPSNLLQQMATHINEFSENDSVKIIKLCSKGDGAFCAGASFDELRALQEQTAATQYFMGFAHVMLAMKSSPKLIVTAVQGKAVGGALGLIASSDYVVATQAASIRLSELALGLGAFVISEPIIRKIGVGHFSALSLDTEWRDADWGSSVGLFSKVVRDHKELDKTTNTLLADLAKGHDKALKLMKQVIWEESNNLEKRIKERAAYSGELALTDWVQKKLKSL